MSSVIEQISQRIENGTMVYFRRKHNSFTMAYAVYTFYDSKGEWKIEFHNTFRGLVVRSLEDLYIRSLLGHSHSVWGSEAQIRLSHKPDNDFPTTDQILGMLRVKRVRCDPARSWDWDERLVVESTLTEILAEDLATWNRDRKAYIRQKHRGFSHLDGTTKGMFPVGLEFCFKPVKKPAFSLVLNGHGEFEAAATQRWCGWSTATRVEPFYHARHVDHWYRKHVTPHAVDWASYDQSSLQDFYVASGVFKGLGVLSVLDLDTAGWGDVDNYATAVATPHALFIPQTNLWTHFHTDNMNIMILSFNERDSQEVKVKLCTDLLSYIQKEALDFTRAYPTFHTAAINKALEFYAICQAPENAGKENMRQLLVICVDLLSKLGCTPRAAAAVTTAAVATVPTVPTVPSPPAAAAAAAAVDTETLSPLERLRLLEQQVTLLQKLLAEKI